MPTDRTLRKVIARARIAAAAVTLAPWLHAQGEVWQLVGDARSETFGEHLARLADRDGDGIDDLLVSVPGYSGSTLTGKLRILSGADLSLLLEIETGPDLIPGAVSAADDFDGDGVEELLIGGVYARAVQLRSGADGRLLREWHGPASPAGFGSLVMGLGDLDGDGLGEIAIGNYNAYDPATGMSGALHLHAGSDGRELATLRGGSSLARVGDRGRVTRLPDLDGDGIEEIAWLDLAPKGGTPVGAVRVTSGANFSELATKWFDTPDLADRQLLSIAVGGDLDGDGCPELLVGAGDIERWRRDGRVYAISTADGHEVWRCDVGTTPAWVNVTRSGDHDGDGVSEIVVATSNGSNFPNLVPLVELRRGVDGALLQQLTGPDQYFWGRNLLAESDYDGDGLQDLALSDTFHVVGGLQTGLVETRSLAQPRVIASREGEAARRLLYGPIARIGDQDGDGTIDFIVGEALGFSGNADQLAIRSGADGHELAVFPLDGVADGALVALPDLDGDGRDDFAVAIDVFGAASRVQLRSSAAGVKLLEIADPNGSGTRFGSVLAAAELPSGAIHLAIGAPLSDVSGGDSGHVDVHDARTGVRLFRKLPTAADERYGAAIASIDDRNGDGIREWAFGAPETDHRGSDTGRIVIVNGANGATITNIYGSVKYEQFGSAIAALGDQDGDGVGEIAVGAPEAASSLGEVRILSGATLATLATFTSTGQADRFGTRLFPIGDVNGDGRDEWIASGSKPMRLELHSGAHARELLEVPLASPYFEFASRSHWEEGTLDDDSTPDLLLVDRQAEEHRSGCSRLALDRLLLDVAPDVAVASDDVALDLRGAPPAALAVLIRVEVDGVPDFRVLGHGFFDGFGEWSTSGTVPPAFPDREWILQGFTLGFDGKLTRSGAVPLRFE